MTYLNSNQKRKTILFGMLVLSLGMSKSWLQAADTFTSANLSSLTSVDPMASATLLDTKAFSIDVPYKDKDGVSRQVTVQASVRSMQVTEVTGTSIDADGKFVENKETKRKIHVSFTSPLCSTAAGCVPDATFDASQSNFNLIASLTAYLGPVVQASYAKNEEAAKELAEKRGDLEKRKKQAEDCKIKIVDENDKSKDLNLSKKENREDQLSCKADKFNAMEFDDDDNGRKKMAAFKRIFGKDIENLVYSKDEDLRAEAAEILADLSDKFDDEDIEEYFSRSSVIAEDYNFALQNAEILADKQNRDPMEVMEASTQLNQGFMQYNGSTQSVLNARLRSGDLSYGEVQAIADMRGQMVETLRMAINNPDQLIGSAQRSVITGSDVTGSRVSGRTSVGGSMPRYIQNNGRMQQPTGRAGQQQQPGYQWNQNGPQQRGPRTRTGTVDPRNYPSNYMR